MQVAKIETNENSNTYWSNLEPMQMAFFLLAQVKEAIPWVRCASGNIWFCDDDDDGNDDNDLI